MKVAEEAYSETVNKGFVISTDPGPGDRVLEDGTVGAVISLGPERHKVPDVRGETLDDAQQALDESKLEYGEAIERYDGKVPKGRAIGTDPAAATPLRRNTAVDVIVSKGPKPIKIPNFTGKRAGPAERALTKRGFKVDTTEVNSDTVPVGLVVSQSPEQRHRPEGRRHLAGRLQGTGVGHGARRHRHGGLEAARQRLAAAGFRVTVRRASLYVGVQYVVTTDPGGGTKAPRGSIVVVGVV